MAKVDLRKLIGRLGATGKEALREAVQLCVSRTHYDVEVEHLLLALLEKDDLGVAGLLRERGAWQPNVPVEIEAGLRRYKTGNAATPRFSPHLIQLLENAWLNTSVEMGADTLEAPDMFLAALEDQEFAWLREDYPSLAEIPADVVREAVLERHRAEGAGEGKEGSRVAPAAAPAGGVELGEDALQVLRKFATDLTAEAEEGRLDPVVERDEEIHRMIQVLLRRRKNNPILLGEPGVGKTAVVEGLAARIAARHVPERLRGVRLYALDLALLQAGAGVRGEFEERVKRVVQAVEGSSVPIILFVDEAHNLIGAGGSAGQGDAANLLKPALARGRLRMIAATTQAEYKKYFEKDAALERRFLPIQVAEPTIEAAERMLRSVVPKLEGHHGVEVKDEAVRAAVRLSERYLSGRKLPDKAVDLLDTACAQVALARGAEPTRLERLRFEVEDLDREIELIERRARVEGDEAVEGLDELRARREELAADLARLEDRCGRAKNLLEEAAAIRRELAEGAGAGDGERAVRLRGKLSVLEEEIRELEEPGLRFPVCVDEDEVAAIVSSWTGIPLGKMLRDDIEAVKRLEEDLRQRIVGQDHVLHAIANTIQISRAKLEDPRKPIGVFLMTGPSGVGKTETALAVADLLYGGEKNLITINMSEYQERHSVSGLKGSPKGYVGYGEGGVLTEAVRQRPYSVVLLDEVDKAHRDVMELFYQVFDKGVLEDTSGRRIDFRNTVIFLTSNLGGDEVIDAVRRNGGRVPTPAELREIVDRPLRAHFPAAFLGRTVVLPYAPLPDEVLAQIARMKLAKVAERMQEQHHVELTFDDSLVDHFVARCEEMESGARVIERIISQSLLPALAHVVLAWMVEEKMPPRIEIGISPAGRITCSPPPPGMEVEEPAEVSGADDEASDEDTPGEGTGSGPTGETGETGDPGEDPGDGK